MYSTHILIRDSLSHSYVVLLALPNYGIQKNVNETGSANTTGLRGPVSSYILFIPGDPKALKN